MQNVRYAQPAELYLGRDSKIARGLAFKRFSNAAEAIQYAVEETSERSLRGSILEVGEARYSGAEIVQLYANEDYPLPRRA
jgi:hypothetical protein